MVDYAKTFSAHGRANTAAGIVAADHDVLHAKLLHRECRDREQVHVDPMDQIGDVPMHEHFARLQTGNNIGGDQAVGAANPEVRPASIYVNER